MFLATGALISILGAVGYALPRVRNIESELPDMIDEAIESA